MKKLIFLIPMFASLFFISCEEDFDPKADYKPKYILACIIRGDTTYQTMTLAKSYDITGYDPYVNHEDPFLSGADIRLWQKDSVFFFRDTTIQRTDTSRYNTPQKFSYINNFKPAEGVNLDIRVITDNGKALWASTTIPKKIAWDTTSNFYLPESGQDYFTFKWIPNFNYGWYLLRYGIRYRNTAAGGETLVKYVPLRYEGNTPIFPKPTKNVGYTFDQSALDRAFVELSEGDPNKLNYEIIGGLIELIICDEQLSKYYSSINGFVDDFTVRVDQSDYTNIDGGLGIFGSYLKQVSGTTYKVEYIQSFGYKFAIN